MCIRDRIGTQDDMVEKVMDILRDHCAKRSQVELVSPPYTCLL